MSQPVAGLLPEPPLSILPSLILALKTELRQRGRPQGGLNEAVILQQLYYLIQQSDQFAADGRQVLCVTHRVMRSKQFPFWSDRTIRRALSDLQLIGVLVTVEGEIVNSHGLPVSFEGVAYALDPARLHEIHGHTRPAAKPGQIDQGSGQIDQGPGQSDQPKPVETGRKFRVRNNKELSSKEEREEEDLTLTPHGFKADVLEAARLCYQLCESASIDVNKPFDSTVEDFALAIQRTHILDKIPVELIVDALKWCLQDDFWIDKCLSPKRWRQRAKRQGPMKIINMIEQYRKRGRGPLDSSAPKLLSVFDIRMAALQLLGTEDRLEDIRRRIPASSGGDAFEGGWLSEWLSLEERLAEVERTEDFARHVALMLLSKAVRFDLWPNAIAFGLSALLASKFEFRGASADALTNYVLSAAQSYKPSDAEYYAGSPKHVALKTQKSGIFGEITRRIMSTEDVEEDRLAKAEEARRRAFEYARSLEE